jgi:hypothetical protein
MPDPLCKMDTTSQAQGSHRQVGRCYIRLCCTAVDPAWPVPGESCRILCWRPTCCMVSQRSKEGEGGLRGDLSQLTHLGRARDRTPEMHLIASKVLVGIRQCMIGRHSGRPLMRWTGCLILLAVLLESQGHGIAVNSVCQLWYT